MAQAQLTFYRCRIDGMYLPDLGTAFSHLKISHGLAIFDPFFVSEEAVDNELSP